MATINVKDASGSTVAIEKPLAPGRAAASASRPVALANEDKAALDDIVSAVTGELTVSTHAVTQSGGWEVVASMPQHATATATIANSDSLSDAVDLGTARLAKINMPASWTEASLTFQTSEDDTVYRDLYDAYGNEIIYTVAANRSVVIDPKDWIATRYVKMRSGTSGSPVNQGGDRALELVAFQ